MERISHPRGQPSCAITKPGTARTRRTKLGLVERSDQGSGITTRHSGGNASVRTAGSFYDEGVHSCWDGSDTGLHRWNSNVACVLPELEASNEHMR